jgi:hypothetical protein
VSLWFKSLQLATEHWALGTARFLSSRYWQLVARFLPVLFFLARLCASAPVLEEASLAGGARPLALGEVTGSSLEGLDALGSNPAAIVGAPNALLLGHAAFPGGLNGEALSGDFNLHRAGNWAFSGLWDDLPGLDQVDASGRTLGTFDFQTGGGSLAYGLNLGDWLALGGQGQYLRQVFLRSNLEELSSAAGLQVKLHAATLGFSASRLGTALPAFQPSAAFYFSPAERLDLLVAAGFQFQTGLSRAGAGAELSYDRSVDFRLGYQVPTDTAQGLDGLANLSAGLGAGVRNLSLDYAILFLGDLGQMHKIQVGFTWE